MKKLQGGPSMKYVLSVLLMGLVAVAACSSGEPAKPSDPPKGASCVWDEGGEDLEHLSADQQKIVDDIAAALTTQLSLKEQGYLVGARYTEIEPAKFHEDPVILRVRTITDSVAPVCKTSKQVPGEIAQAISIKDIRICTGDPVFDEDAFLAARCGAYYDKENQLTTPKFLSCLAYEYALFTAFSKLGCNNEHEEGSPDPVPDDVDPIIEKIADPQAWENSPINLSCHPPCTDGQACNTAVDPPVCFDWFECGPEKTCPAGKHCDLGYCLSDDPGCPFNEECCTAKPCPLGQSCTLTGGICVDDDPHDLTCANDFPTITCGDQGNNACAECATDVDGDCMNEYEAYLAGFMLGPNDSPGPVNEFFTCFQTRGGSCVNCTEQFPAGAQIVKNVNDCVMAACLNDCQSFGDTCF